MNERRFQAHLIKRIRSMFTGVIILKNDAGYIQGMPDLLLLFNDTWAALEVKASASSPLRPNQEYYVGLMDTMSFAAFIYPENEEEVLYDLQQTFELHRSARIS